MTVGYAPAGTGTDIDIRGRRPPARIVPLPFYRRGKASPPRPRRRSRHPRPARPRPYRPAAVLSASEAFTSRGPEPSALMPMYPSDYRYSTDHEWIGGLGRGGPGGHPP